MYKIYKIYNVVEDTRYLIHRQDDDVLRVLNPRISLALNKTGSFEFSINPMHLYAETLKKLKSIIEIRENDTVIYRGRMISDNSDFHNTKNVVCEGVMAFFMDSIQRPFSLEGYNINAFLQYLVNSHNNQVESKKRITLGMVSVTGEGGDAIKENTSYSSTWDILNSQLIDRFGGYLWISYGDNENVLNYTWDYGGINEQEIRFGVNLLDISKYQDATQIKTRIIPTGADVEYEDELGEKKTKTIDITSVNNGNDYIDAEQSVLDEYGIITGALNWSNITDPTSLLEKAKSYLRDMINIPEQLTISTVDLNYIGVDIQSLKLGCYTSVISKPHNIQTKMMLSQLTMYLDNPSQGQITLGEKTSSLTSSVSHAQKLISSTIEKGITSTINEINRKVENATILITGGLGGYVILDNIDPNTGKKTHPWRILIMNTPDKNTAKNVIQFNQNGIGFSTNGIDGPYNNAWTIDGNLVADFITSGSMLADRIRGGTLDIGGSGVSKDGKITVHDIDNKTIGYWDKTGLHVLKGLIEGTDIIGANIKGGTIDIDHGTFAVNSDGEVSISSGEISIGKVYISEGYTWLGDFGISATGDGMFYSRDSRGSVQIYSINFPYENGPAIILTNGSTKTRIGYGGIVTGDISLKRLESRWSEWGSVADNIIALWDRIEDIENNM